MCGVVVVWVCEGSWLSVSRRVCVCGGVGVLSCVRVFVCGEILVGVWAWVCVVEVCDVVVGVGGCVGDMC